jgi:hypothetical protein
MLYYLIVRQESFLSEPSPHVIHSVSVPEPTYLVPYDTLTLLLGNIHPIFGQDVRADMRFDTFSDMADHWTYLRTVYLAT